MAIQQTIQSFKERQVRTAWNSDQEKWYFSVVDVCSVLTDSKNPTDYLKKLRKREPELNTYIGTNCPQVPMTTESGKQRLTLAADLEHLSFITQFINSPQKEEFKKWVEQITKYDETDDFEQLPDIEEVHGEVVLYQPNDTIRLEVHLKDDTVWLTQSQIIDLFQSSRANISEHIANIYEQGELVYGATVRNFRTVQKEGSRTVTRTLTYYNLDVIISVGFRVNAKRGIRFRQWANGVIKNYLLRGYAVNQNFQRLEQRMDSRLDAQQKQLQMIESTLVDHQEKIDFFVRTNQPPVEGILFEGQIFDAYKLVETLIKSAKHEIILIDNYIDATVFDLLEKRGQDVDATIYTEHVGSSLTHLQQLNHQQYGRTIEVKEYSRRFHDRFLILDDDPYHFGASFKDLGKRLFAFELMGLKKEVILNQL